MAYPNQNSEEGPCLSQQLFSSFCIPLVQIGTIVCLLVIATVWPLKAAAKNLPPSAVESVQDFFDQVGHKSMYASSGNKHFFTKLCHRQPYQNYEQKLAQNLYYPGIPCIFNRENPQNSEPQNGPRMRLNFIALVTKYH